MSGSCMGFSANLGFLRQELALCDAVHAAARAGFDAVECHWPFETPAAQLTGALAQTGLPMLGLNTRRGNAAAGDFGLSAVPGREQEVRAHIDEAIDYCHRIGGHSVHVMAGRSDGGDAAGGVFRDNLRYACERAGPLGVQILIEPINLRDVPAYHLCHVEAAAETIGAVARPNLKLMFDCYHVQIMQGDLLTRLSTYLPLIGHLQIAAVPDRGEPDQGELNYAGIIEALSRMGYRGYIGAEYRPRGTTDEGLRWLDSHRSRS